MATLLNINGKDVEIGADGDTPLLWVLRDELGLTGTKFGCGIAACGACTVLMNGEPVRSCQTFLQDAAGAKITTIEEVSGKEATAIQAAWTELDVVQCGYCQSGQIMQAISLLQQTPKPSDADIDAAMSGNVCRCATYHRIRAAVHLAASMLEG